MSESFIHAEVTDYDIQKEIDGIRDLVVTEFDEEYSWLR